MKWSRSLKFEESVCFRAGDVAPAFFTDDEQDAAMHLDAIDLKDFYASPLGLVVRRLLGARLRARWSNVQGQSLFGLGFATPYLGAFRADACPLGALMPADLGVIPWPNQAKGLSVLVDQTELPLADECADRILLVHMLEWSERTRPLLRELWRVLAPNGRLLLIVPNRRGLWARVDTTPFGHGRPFSRSQLTRLLQEAMFSPEQWHHALYMPPFSWRILLKWPVFWERLGLVLWPAFSGVLMVEATKQIYAGVPVKESRKLRRRVVPVPAGVTPRTTFNTTRHAGLDPGIHAATSQRVEAPVEWIAGSSPAMTMQGGE